MIIKSIKFGNKCVFITTHSYLIYCYIKLLINDDFFINGNSLLKCEASSRSLSTFFLFDLMGPDTKLFLMFHLSLTAEMSRKNTNQMNISFVLLRELVSKNELNVEM